MENNLILEGLLSMVTELKERQERQTAAALICWKRSSAGNGTTLSSEA